MRLNLRDILHEPGAKLPFQCEVDLSDIDFYGRKPFTQPIKVHGMVRNMAGALVLTGQLSTELDLVCDRCMKPFRREKKILLNQLLAAELENEEDEDQIILLDGDELDVDELVYTAMILEMDTKNLCSEDCKGLCPGCGANLNEEPCRCKPEADPRWNALTQLLDKTE